MLELVIPLNVRDLPSFVSFFVYFIFSGVKKSTIHSFAGSSDLKKVDFNYIFTMYIKRRIKNIFSGGINSSQAHHHCRN